MTVTDGSRAPLDAGSAVHEVFERERRTSYRRHQLSTAGWVGFLLGTSAAVVGVSAVSSSPLRPWHILMLIGLAVALLSTSARVVATTRLTAVEVSVLAFVASALLAEVVNSTQLRFTPDITSVIAPMYYLLAFFAARTAVSDRETFVKFVTYAAVPVLPSAALCIGQSLSASFAALVLRVAPSDGLDSRLADNRLIRATALIGHWTGAGFYFCAMLAAIAVAIIVNRQLGRSNAWLTVSAGGCLVGVLSTSTISVIAAAVAVLIVLLVAVKARLSVLLATPLLGIGGYLLFGQALVSRVEQQTTARGSGVLPSWVPNTLNYRFRIWTGQTLPAISERPWSGWGYGVYTDTSNFRMAPSSLIWPSAESQWFYLAITFGWLSVLLFAISCGCLLAAVLGVARRAGRVVAGPMTVLLIAVLFVSITVPVFTNRGFPMAWWSMLGALVGAFPHRPTGRAEPAGGAASGASAGPALRP